MQHHCPPPSNCLVCADAQHHIVHTYDFLVTPHPISLSGCAGLRWAQTSTREGRYVREHGGHGAYCGCHWRFGGGGHGYFVVAVAFVVLVMDHEPRYCGGQGRWGLPWSKGN